jgi:hypothetical protein
MSLSIASIHPGERLSISSGQAGAGSSWGPGLPFSHGFWVQTWVWELTEGSPLLVSVIQVIEVLFVHIKAECSRLRTDFSSRNTGINWLSPQSCVSQTCPRMEMADGFDTAARDWNHAHLPLVIGQLCGSRHCRASWKLHSLPASVSSSVPWGQ